jgi:glycosyltransferase involved in cell wall biosynthesis
MREGYQPYITDTTFSSCFSAGAIRTRLRGDNLENGRVRVFVHLAFGFGGESWNRRWKQGQILGINEPFPYGYYRADAMGCKVTYSRDHEETALKKLFRLGVRAILGFDLIHAWRNFNQMERSDVVWTHTESQYLGILLLYHTVRRGRCRPKLIAQSIWLFDRWSKFSHLRKLLFSWLIRKADILTVHSPLNLEVARRLFPNVPSELVLFGIAADQKILPRRDSSSPGLNIVSLGNDEHRDWDLLIRAVATRSDWRLRIASQKVSPSSIGGATNIEIARLQTNDELFALYQWADVLVLALKPNLHASGITVIQEAALRGVPVICSDTGGLKAYFSNEEVRFVPPLDAAALRKEIDAVARTPVLRHKLAQLAQARMGVHGLGSEAFARSHVEISQRLLFSDRSVPSYDR